MATRIDEIVEGIYRICTWQPQYGITFNQFLIADEQPALIQIAGYCWAAKSRTQRRCEALPQ
jgi:hypothetical protein